MALLLWMGLYPLSPPLHGFILMEVWHQGLAECLALLSTHFKSLMLASTPVMLVCPHHFLLVLIPPLIHSPSVYCVSCLSVNVCITPAEFRGLQGEWLPLVKFLVILQTRADSELSTDRQGQMICARLSTCSLNWNTIFPWSKAMAATNFAVFFFMCVCVCVWLLFESDFIPSVGCPGYQWQLGKICIGESVRPRGYWVILWWGRYCTSQQLATMWWLTDAASSMHSLSIIEQKHPSS